MISTQIYLHLTKTIELILTLTDNILTYVKFKLDLYYLFMNLM